MGSSWDQTDVSVALANALKIGFDGFEASVFTSGTTVGLERNIIKLGDFLKPISQLFDHCGVTFGLVFRNEWMDVQLWPAHWNHFAGCI